MIDTNEMKKIAAELLDVADAVEKMTMKSGLRHRYYTCGCYAMDCPNCGMTVYCVKGCEQCNGHCQKCGQFVDWAECFSDENIEVIDNEQKVEENADGN